MRLLKLSFLFLLLLAPNSFSEDSENKWGDGKKVYSFSNCMNNFKYCTKGNLTTSDSIEKEKGSRDCSQFNQYCKPILPEICESLKNAGYDCGLKKDLEKEYLKKLIEKLEEGEDEELSDKILKAINKIENDKKIRMEEILIKKQELKAEELKKEERKNNPRTISLF